jgi:hypothetical protein
MEWTFGKHKGIPASQVPLNYLIWCSEQMPRVPECVIAELKRRSSYDVQAGAAVSSLAFRPKITGKKKRKRVRRPAKARRQEPKTSAAMVGEHYTRLQQEFTAAGGDSSACPFDVKGDAYSGPRIGVVDGVSRMVWLGPPTDKR